MTQRLGILGYPLRHSISPAFQQAALDCYGIDARYEVWETPPEELPRRVQWTRSEGVLGANVTVPHKEAVGGLLDEVDDLARHLGSVNTLVARGSRLVGYNTDVAGFLRALREDAGFDCGGKRALVLGAGGVGRTVALALTREGVASLAIANRTVERARSLVAEYPSLQGVEVISLEYQALARQGEGVPWDLIVNCTTLGMGHGPGEGVAPLPATLISPDALVYDLVYNPVETPLLREARKAGANTLGGLPMLIYQGAEAFRLWTGREPPLRVMFRAAEAALGIGAGSVGKPSDS